MRLRGEARSSDGSVGSAEVEIVRAAPDPGAGVLVPAGTDAIAAIQAAIATGRSPVVLGNGIHELDPRPLIGTAGIKGLNACLDVGGTTGLEIRGESRAGAVLRLRAADYLGLGGSGLDLHMIGGRSSRPIVGFRLRNLTVDGSWLAAGMTRSEQMHAFHAYSPIEDILFEEVDFRRIPGDSAKFMHGRSIRALRCTHTDNGRSAWAFHQGVSGFESIDERFVRISDQWIDCEPGRECYGFRVLRASAPDGFLTTGSVDDFLLEDVETGSIMIGSPRLVRLVRPRLSSRQVGMNNAPGAVRQMSAVWTIKEVERLEIEDPEIVADAANGSALVSLGYRVNPIWQLNPDGTDYVDPATGERVQIGKKLNRTLSAAISGGTISGGAAGGSAVGASEALEVSVDGTTIDDVDRGVSFNFRGAALDPSFLNRAGPWTVRAAAIRARSTGIVAGLSDRAEGATLRLGRSNEIVAPTPLSINRRISVEEIE